MNTNIKEKGHIAFTQIEQNKIISSKSHLLKEKKKEKKKKPYMVPTPLNMMPYDKNVMPKAFLLVNLGFI